MTKSTILLIGLIALLCTAATAGDVAGDLPWFDMEKCTFCKHITAEEGLMEHMNFEYHNHSKGILSITVVDKEYKEAFTRVSKAMEAEGEKMMASMSSNAPPPYMCGHCAGYGEFIMAGVMPEVVTTSKGEITLWVSDKPEMVTKLQAFAKRTTDEHKKIHADMAE